MKNISYSVERNCYVNERGQEVDPKTGRIIGLSERFVPPDAAFLADLAALPHAEGPVAPGDVATDQLVYKIPRQDGGFGFERSDTPFPISHYRQAAVDIVAELINARKYHGPMTSAHHGYAVMLEEMDEVKAHVWVKQKNRDQAAMRKELVQLAAMAVAMIVEIADADNRR